MGAKAKLTLVILILVIAGLAVWQFTAPPLTPPVGPKYSGPGPYSTRGSWIINEKTSYGNLNLAFSISNTTYPRTTLPTGYSFIISDYNQTLSNSFVKGIGIRITALTIQDNFNASTTTSGTGGLTDATQVTSQINLLTSATHQLRFTISYQLDNIFLIGYSQDHSTTRSFNITQIVI